MNGDVHVVRLERAQPAEVVVRADTPAAAADKAEQMVSEFAWTTTSTVLIDLRAADVPDVEAVAS